MNMKAELAYHIDFERTSPFRSLDWRWRMADELLNRNDQVLELVGQIDEGVFKCIKFRRWLSSAHEPAVSTGLEDELSGHHAAWLLAEESDRDLRRQPAGIPLEEGSRLGAQILRRQRLLQRWQVEARVLAGETSESIAEAVGLPPEAIVAFESCFWHVNDRLEATSWINRFAVRKQRREPLKLPVDFGVVLRHFAFWDGSEALEELLKNRRVFLDAFGELAREDRSTDEIERLLELIGTVQSFVTGMDAKRYVPMAEISSRFIQLRDLRTALQKSEISFQAAREFLKCGP